MKVYLANFFSKKDQVKQYAQELQALGVGVTARWFTETIPHTAKMSEVPEAYHRETAMADVDDINAADAVVLFSSELPDYADIPPRSLARGGRHVEAGLALAGGKMLIVCGPRENVFHYLPEVKQFDTWDQTKEYLTNVN